MKDQRERETHTMEHLTGEDTLHHPLCHIYIPNIGQGNRGTSPSAAHRPSSHPGCTLHMEGALGVHGHQTPVGAGNSLQKELVTLLSWCPPPKTRPPCGTTARTASTPATRSALPSVNPRRTQRVIPKTIITGGVRQDQSCLTAPAPGSLTPQGWLQDRALSTAPKPWSWNTITLLFAEDELVALDVF